MRLYFKLDHVATLRFAGGGKEPEPVVAAALAELEGIGGITIHLHADRGNVKLRDVQVLKETLSVPLNLELAPIAKSRQHAFDLRPDTVTLVQEPRDVGADRWPIAEEEREHVAGFIRSLQEAELRSALFLKPSVDAVRFAHKTGATQVLLDTTAYSLATTPRDVDHALEALGDSVRLGQKLGMEVHLGGGIDYHNAARLAALPVAALHVGYAIVARSVLAGVPRAVAQMLDLIEKNRP